MPAYLVLADEQPMSGHPRRRQGLQTATMTSGKVNLGLIQCMCLLSNIDWRLPTGEMLRQCQNGRSLP